MKSTQWCFAKVVWWFTTVLLFPGDEGKPNIEVIILVCTGAAATFLWIMLILFIRKLRKVRRYITSFFQKPHEISVCQVQTAKQVTTHLWIFCGSGSTNSAPITLWKHLSHVSCEIQFNGRIYLARFYDFHISWQLGSALQMVVCMVWPQRNIMCSCKLASIFKSVKYVCRARNAIVMSTF